MLTVRNKTIIILVVLAALQGTSFANAGPARAPSTLQPMVVVQSEMIAPCYLYAFSTSFTKICNLANFNVLSANSVVELVLNGRIQVSTFNISSSGANFELRVDDAATEIGIARTNIRAAEAGVIITISMTGFFSGLAPGQHTASMWVEGVYSGGNEVYVNPGGWLTDYLAIKEYTPFGFSYLPLVNK